MSDKPTQLKDTLLKRIESEHVSPRSRLFFQGREVLVWVLWLLSVVVGALAVAVMLFVLTHRQYALYELTHDNYYTFIIDTLPYMWLVLFGMMAAAAVYNLRHTKRGYRYSATTVIFSSLAVSFVAGFALQYYGMGYTIDHLLGETVSPYMSHEKQEFRLWQAPEDGRLLGKQILGGVGLSTTTLKFEDISGNEWLVDVSELTPRDIEMLTTESKVRLFGTTTGPESRQFHVCGALPWAAAKGMSVKQMRAEREGFIERVAVHLRNENRLQEMSLATSSPENGPCAMIPPARRVALPR